MPFLESKNIKIYPSAYRGYNSDLDKLYNPESRLPSENNISNMTYCLTEERDGFTVSSVGRKIKFVLRGYLFEADFTAATQDIDSGYLWVGIKRVAHGNTLDTDNVDYEDYALGSFKTQQDNNNQNANSNDSYLDDYDSTDAVDKFYGLVYAVDSSSTVSPFAAGDNVEYALCICNLSNNTLQKHLKFRSDTIANRDTNEAIDSTFNTDTLNVSESANFQSVTQRGTSRVMPRSSYSSATGNVVTIHSDDYNANKYKLTLADGAGFKLDYNTISFIQSYYDDDVAYFNIGGSNLYYSDTNGFNINTSAKPIKIYAYNSTTTMHGVEGVTLEANLGDINFITPRNINFKGYPNSTYGYNFYNDTYKANLDVTGINQNVNIKVPNKSGTIVLNSDLPLIESIKKDNMKHYVAITDNIGVSSTTLPSNLTYSVANSCINRAELVVEDSNINTTQDISASLYFTIGSQHSDKMDGSDMPADTKARWIRIDLLRNLIPELTDKYYRLQVKQVFVQPILDSATAIFLTLYKNAITYYVDDYQYLYIGIANYGYVPSYPATADANFGLSVMVKGVIEVNNSD